MQLKTRPMRLLEKSKMLKCPIQP